MSKSRGIANPTKIRVLMEGVVADVSDGKYRGAIRKADDLKGMVHRIMAVQGKLDNGEYSSILKKIDGAVKNGRNVSVVQRRVSELSRQLYRDDVYLGQKLDEKESGVKKPVINMLSTLTEQINTLRSLSGSEAQKQSDYIDIISDTVSSLESYIRSMEVDPDLREDKNKILDTVMELEDVEKWKSKKYIEQVRDAKSDIRSFVEKVSEEPIEEEVEEAPEEAPEETSEELEEEEEEGLWEQEGWERVLGPTDDFVGLVLGGRRKGKSTFAAWFCTEVARKKGKKFYIIGIPADKQKEFPSEFGFVPLEGVAQRVGELPNDAVFFYDEAQMGPHARESEDIGMIIDRALARAGHKNQYWMFVTHEARKIDINIVSAVNGLFFKEPQMLQARFDREEITEYAERARKEFEEVDNVLDYVWCETEEFRGMLKNGVADWWGEEHSHIFR